MEGSRPGRLNIVNIFLILIILAMGVMLFAESALIMAQSDLSLPFKKLSPISNKVAVIYVEGTMVTDNVPEGFGYASSNNIIKSLRAAQEDKSVKAIVLRINSPGGTPVAAQEVYSQIEKTREVKPVVVSMGDLATSAAYYISSPCDKIFANPDTFTGSIGVIWVFENRSAYYNKEGIDYYVAKTGTYKDVGADWRGLNESEKQYVYNIINASNHHFISAVSEGRNIPVQVVEMLADGRVYTGDEAIALGLVDEIGSMYDAIDAAAKMGNITGTPDITYMNEPSLYSLLFGEQSQGTALGYDNKFSDPAKPGGFYYSPYGRLYMI
ncbi:signal peptide peptidase SppA [Methanocella sp. CWC-04]|uniref:Signal peptide peptidase SppA n=1 Tax=Methanooceanicella nereidis TaxID=2052831 RepID=A0AAP2RCJ2_9EURY|nr:signal peptide peptidase SppA [Methanocella sp. CWC-04]MCD1294774.1 signal peptide peptidase SppA [Methanocella sp. CWC-04]